MKARGPLGGLGHYVLDADGRTPILEEDFLAWARWFEAAGEKRRVGWTEIGTLGHVSTIFLGLDHRFGDGGRPVLFETMTNLSGEWGDDYFARYCTWDEAEAGHARIVREAMRRIEQTAMKVSDALVPGSKVEGKK